ncbi:PREDICTED: serine/threonine-protein phosphatase 7 long form homolog [Nicotiana attenuata]|uniref:serine/threonine-protein phosphatase 7 long form homolog n=1 Tax=Nicotiana attenuata TaxID=49451 RepID=UPI00090466CE|nr:PREDICTED: serine/threonine-protein phosphatase 7 long form homolog [Nicotiana attenuata]
MEVPPLHPRVVRLLQDTGFYRIAKIGRLQLDWSLLMPLIERWRPETHIFHLPIGEATITLQEVKVLYGLPVDGYAVALPRGMRDYTGAQYLETLHRLTGFRPEDEGVLVVHVAAIARLIVPDTLGNLDSLRLLHHLKLLDDLPQYSWGAAVLGYIYRLLDYISSTSWDCKCSNMPARERPLCTTMADKLQIWLPGHCREPEIVSA